MDTHGQRVEEAALTVRVALDALPLLRRAGFRVVLSRTGAAAVARPLPGDLASGVFTGEGVHRDLIARDVCADRARASVLLGVYFDASVSAAARGSLTLYDAARPFWRASRRLSELVQRAVLARLSARGLSVPDDGVHTDVGFGSSVTSADRAYGHLLILGPAKAGYLATPSTMPGALIEPLFLTNPADASMAASAPGQDAIARGLAAAVEQYFGSQRLHSKNGLPGARAGSSRSSSASRAAIAAASRSSGAMPQRSAAASTSRIALPPIVSVTLVSSHGCIVIPRLGNRGPDTQPLRPTIALRTTTEARTSAPGGSSRTRLLSASSTDGAWKVPVRRA